MIQENGSLTVMSKMVRPMKLGQLFDVSNVVWEVRLRLKRKMT